MPLRARVPATSSKKRSSLLAHPPPMTTPTPRHHAASSPPLAVPTLLLLLLLLLLDAAPAAAQQQSPSRDKDNGGGVGPGGGGGMPGQPPSFSAPMVVLLVALIAAFFFIGFFSVYMRRCGRGASSASGIPAAALLVLSRQEERERNRQQRGLDPAVVASFPTMRYADARALRVGDGKDAALECAVCLSEFEDDEELRLLPTCSHAFHPDCIGEWLAGHVTCPVCRRNLDPEAAEPASAEAAGSGEVAGEVQQDPQVAIIDVSHDGSAEDEEERRRREEAVELERIGSQRRAVRSRSGRPAAAAPPVPRSHSTGHSLAARLDGDDLERFTLRLPEHVRREMVAAAGEESLRRTAPRDARGGNGGARSARLGRSDRWPSFISRTFSSRVPFWSASRRAPDLAEAAAAAGTGSTGAAARTRRDKTGGGASDGSVTPAKGSVRFDCLGVGVAPAVTGARVGAAAGDSETEEDEEKAIVRHA